MPAHTHTTGLQLITLFAAIYVINVSVRTICGRHSDRPAARGIAYGI